MYQQYRKILKQTDYTRSILSLHYNTIPIIVFIDLLLFCYIIHTKVYLLMVVALCCTCRQKV